MVGSDGFCIRLSGPGDEPTDDPDLDQGVFRPFVSHLHVNVRKSLMVFTREFACNRNNRNVLLALAEVGALRVKEEVWRSILCFSFIVTFGSADLHNKRPAPTHLLKEANDACGGEQFIGTRLRCA